MRTPKATLGRETILASRVSARPQKKPSRSVTFRVRWSAGTCATGFASVFTIGGLHGACAEHYFAKLSHSNPTCKPSARRALAKPVAHKKPHANAWRLMKSRNAAGADPVRLRDQPPGVSPINQPTAAPFFTSCHVLAGVAIDRVSQ